MAYVLRKNKLKNGDTTYYIASHTRIPGTNKHKEVILERYSSSELTSDGKDPEEFTQKRLKELREESEKEEKSLSYPINFTLKAIKTAESNYNQDNKSLGYLPFLKIYHLLGLDYEINKKKRNTEYNISSIFQLLLYSSLLFKGTIEEIYLKRSYFFLDSDYTLSDLYAASLLIYNQREELIKALDNKLTKRYGEKGTVIHYISQYYLGLEKPELDNEITVRQLNKSHKENPIGLLGLYTDKRGIPITYDFCQPSGDDSLRLKAEIENSVINLKDRKNIIVADSDLLCFENIQKIIEDENGYILSASILRIDQDSIDFALSSEGWKTIEEVNGEVKVKYKERIAPLKVSNYKSLDGRKKSSKYSERQIIIWSEAYQEKKRLKRADDIIKAETNVGIKNKNSRDLNYGKLKYLKRKIVKDGDRIIPDAIEIVFDEEELKKEEELDGYFILCTNILGVENEEEIDYSKDNDSSFFTPDGLLHFNEIIGAERILEYYQRFWTIENSFKIQKNELLRMENVYPTLLSRLETHLLFSFLSLLMERVAEYETGINANSLKRALSRFIAVPLPFTNVYQVSYYDKTIDECNKALSIPLDKKFYTLSDIKKIIADIKKP